MAHDNMVLFAQKLKLESRWNELFLENGGLVTPEMSALGDQVKSVFRLILKNQENPRNIRDGENHSYAS